VIDALKICFRSSLWQFDINRASRSTGGGAILGDAAWRSLSKATLNPQARASGDVGFLFASRGGVW
jgi:hypothetical protein